jgi:hypothetical protein
MKHYRTVIDAREALDTANGIYRAALKSAKSDGINQTEMLAAIKCKKMQPEDVENALRARLRYMEWLGMPIGTQLGLFPSPPDPEAEEELSEIDADEAGYTAGRTGGSTDDTNAVPGTPAYAAFVKGYRRGQAAIAAEMGPAAKVASTRRKRVPKDQNGAQPALVQ